MSESEVATSESCPQCGGVCPDGARYCPSCGAGLFPLESVSSVSALPSSRPPSRKAVLRSGRVPPLRAAVEPHADAHRYADPLLGRVVADRYRILEQIGRGGMGVVYRAEHVRIGKLMALKLLSGELTQDGLQVARFKREALMASKLSHPNTVQVFDFGTTEGLVYLAMEYLRGEDLGDIIDREGALELNRAIKLVVQIASSLGEAHEKGIVHRDLKPENIFIVRGHSGEEVVKVLDFGLAKLRESSELSEVTTHGAIVGTPYYMSPEQIRGENVGTQSDVYSLGALTYMCLTGEAVFDASTPLGVLTKHLTESPLAPHLRRPTLRIPARVSALVLSALDKDPSKRPDGVLAFQQGLIAAVQGDAQGDIQRLLSSGELQKLTDEDSKAATRDEIEQYERKLKRRGRLAMGALGAFVATLATLGVWTYRNLTATPEFDGWEIEPNNGASQAQAVPFGRAVQGRLGQRLDRERSDRDFFRMRVPEGTQAIRLSTTALPNMALCVWIYASEAESALGRYCSGASDVDLLVEQLTLPPGEYLMAVMQDREAYTRLGAPPVLENVSDSYRLLVTSTKIDATHEVEPNDSPQRPTTVPAPGQVVMQLAFMRDVDVVCTRSDRPISFVVQEDKVRMRPNGSVLQVTARAGPDRDVPVRIHREAQKESPLKGDAQSPWTSPVIPPNGAPVCLELTLVPNPRAEWPMPTIAPASPVPYTVSVRLVE